MLWPGCLQDLQVPLQPPAIPTSKEASESSRSSSPAKSRQARGELCNPVMLEFPQLGKKEEEHPRISVGSEDVRKKRGGCRLYGLGAFMGLETSALSLIKV